MSETRKDGLVNLPECYYCDGVAAFWINSRMDSVPRCVCSDHIKRARWDDGTAEYDTDAAKEAK